MRSVYQSKFKAGRKYILPSILLVIIWGLLLRWRSSISPAASQHLLLELVGTWQGSCAWAVHRERRGLVQMGVSAPCLWPSHAHAPPPLGAAPPLPTAPHSVPRPYRGGCVSPCAISFLMIFFIFGFHRPALSAKFLPDGAAAFPPSFTPVPRERCTAAAHRQV